MKFKFRPKVENVSKRKQSFLKAFGKAAAICVISSSLMLGCGTTHKNTRNDRTVQTNHEDVQSVQDQNVKIARKVAMGLFDLSTTAKFTSKHLTELSKLLKELKSLPIPEPFSLEYEFPLIMGDDRFNWHLLYTKGIRDSLRDLTNRNDLVDKKGKPLVQRNEIDDALEFLILASHRIDRKYPRKPLKRPEDFKYEKHGYVPKPSPDGRRLGWEYRWGD
ncbi:hypothetical protein KAW38_01070 [Candidatus Micrarchaeota archaeon]|nr:hypothetical protein [Candidatus Micrarchaeota archaeon]